MEAGFFYGDMVRLHVLAHSDVEADQRLKMQVVQAVRRRAVRVVRGAADAGQAYDRLYRARGALRRSAARAARRRGFFGPVAVEMGVFPFPRREYGGQIAPEGLYRAVRVKLGAAAGRNWWCVLYPQLCAVEESCAQALASPEAIHFYSSIGRFVRQLLQGVGLC